MKEFQTLAFYLYVPMEEPKVFTAEHLTFCKSIGIKGRIYVADEGINGSVSGTIDQCAKYMAYMNEHPTFSTMEFKIDEEDAVSFNKMHVKYRHELVHFGVGQVDPLQNTANHLSAQEVLDLKDQEDVYMLDVRNKVEYEVGKFKDALTLDIDTFREFPDKIEELEPYKDKKIIAYCTGGIRCEKATALLLQHGFKRENLFQIDGGILKYSKETGGKDFDGKCYVFDKRIVTDVNEVNPTIISKCLNCGTETAKMVNCSNPECNEHFVQCADCGWEMQGACSTACKEHPRKRDYDGSGYYARTGEQM